MKRLFILSLFCYILVGCTTDRDIYQLIYDKWAEHKSQNFIFDFSKSIDFEWDTMYVYSAKCTLESINEDLGIPYSDFIDVGEHIIFLKENKIVYSQTWYSVEYESSKGIVFSSLVDKLKFSPKNAKFTVIKRGDTFILSEKK